MRRRLVGAALTIVGVLAVVFVPIVGVGGCADCVAGRKIQVADAMITGRTTGGV
jgi:hypothetical protein